MLACLHRAEQLPAGKRDMNNATAVRAQGRVTGKAALITGGARGQGRGHARLLAQHGARVLIGDVLDAAGEEAARALQGGGLDVRYIHLDVTSPQSWDDAVARAEHDFGRLDILVNNAGIFPSANIVDCSLA